MDETLHWFVALTRPGRDGEALEKLAEAGVAAKALLGWRRVRASRRRAGARWALGPVAPGLVLLGMAAPAEADAAARAAAADRAARRAAWRARVGREGHDGVALSGCAARLADPWALDWAAVFGVEAVRGVLGQGAPRELTPDELAAIAAWADARGEPADERGWRPAVGETVKVRSGPFAGFPGWVQAVAGSEVELVVMLFGRETPVKAMVSSLDEAA